MDAPRQSPHPQRQRILDAARALFLSRGYNGSNLRDIASQAKVSMGGIYHHFASKEEIYRTLLTQGDLARDLFQILRLFQSPEFPSNLQAVGRAIGETVTRHKDTFKLFYIDVLEFQGRHVRPLIQEFRDGFGELSSLLLRNRTPKLEHIHPAIILRVMIDTFMYTRLEEAMLGSPIGAALGLSDDDVTRQMAEVILRGVLG